jgi:hypothetical protein
VGYPWAELLKRVFAVDVLSCHRCGGRREVLALITDGTAVRAVLECVGLPDDAPLVHPGRGMPQLFRAEGVGEQRIVTGRTGRGWGLHADAAPVRCDQRS